MVAFNEGDAVFYNTGIDHGTITVSLDGFQCEVTTLRKDVVCDGRHAEVEFTTDFEEDAQRRDFTINGLFMAIDGEVVDYVKGQEDIKHGILRFIGVPQQMHFAFFAYSGLPLQLISPLKNSHAK